MDDEDDVRMSNITNMNDADDDIITRRISIKLI